MKATFKSLIHTAAQTGLVKWAIILLVTVSGALFVIKVPLTMMLTHARLEGAQNQAKLEKVQAIAQGHQTIDDVLDRLRRQYEGLKSRVLKPGEQSRVISLLTQTTDDLSISILNIEEVKQEDKKEGEPIPPVEVRQFDVEMIARYRTLGEFFDRLSDSPLILRIEKIKIRQKTDKSVFLNAALRLAAYEESGL